MGQFVRIGSKAELEDLEGGRLVEAQGHTLAVFNLGGSIHVLDNKCTHRGGPLAEGAVVEDEVICPWHGAHFNIKTGVVTSPPAPNGVKSYSVRVSGDDVEVEIE